MILTSKVGSGPPTPCVSEAHRFRSDLSRRRARAQYRGASAELRRFEDKGVKQATEADIERFIADFAAGAERAAKAGLDGVELHGAHGYLLCQFLRADINTRQDSWGGRSKSARFIRSVMQAVRARVPKRLCRRGQTLTRGRHLYDRSRPG